MVNSYLIYTDTDGETIFAKNGSTGDIDYVGKNASIVIQEALNNLTFGRTWKEKIEIQGNYTIINSLDIPSYTIVELNGTLTRSGTGYHLITGSSVNNIEILSGIIVSAHKVTTVYDTDEIDFIDSNDILIDGVRIENAAEDAIMFRGTSHDIKITRCNLINSCIHAIDLIESCYNVIVSDNYVDGVSYYDGITVYVYNGHDIVISKNTITNVLGEYNDEVGTSSSAIHIEDTTPSDSNYITITENTIYNCTFGITTWQGRPCTITKNTIKNTLRGIFLGHPMWSTINENIIDNSEMTEENNGIYIAGAIHNLISYNIIRGDSGSLYTTGIYHTKEGDYNNNDIIGNEFHCCFMAMKNVGSDNTFLNNKSYYNVNINSTPPGAIIEIKKHDMHIFHE